MSDFEKTTERRLSDHAERIRKLEIKDATQNEQLVTLFKKLDELSDDIRDLMAFMKSILWKTIGGMGMAITILLGFFFWYVQRLGGG